MLSPVAESVLIVTSGALLTLLIGGALVYWIDREWRDLDSRRRRRRDAQDMPDERRPDRPPGS